MCGVRSLSSTRPGMRCAKHMPGAVRRKWDPELASLASLPKSSHASTNAPEYHSVLWAERNIIRFKEGRAAGVAAFSTLVTIVRNLGIAAAMCEHGKTAACTGVLEA